MEEKVVLDSLTLRVEMTGTADSGEGSAKSGNNEQLQLSPRILCS